MGPRDEALKLALVGVEADKVALLLQPQGPALHADGPKPRQHQGAGVLDPFQDLPWRNVFDVLNPQPLGKRADYKLGLVEPKIRALSKEVKWLGHLHCP